MAHRRRRRSRRRRARERRQLAALAAVLAAVIAVVGLLSPHSRAASSTASTASAGRTSSNRVAAAAIAYARKQLGKPYLWGGNGPYAYDCSGLVQQAYESAGVSTLPRTSEDQWQWGPQVSTAQDGDLVFFAGGDGTALAPGHVGIVINASKHQMIEAYAPGYPIRISTYGLSDSPDGDSPVVGFTAPWQRAGGGS